MMASIECTAPAQIPAAVAAILEAPESELDYAAAKMTLDRLLDPASDVGATMKELDRLESETRGFIGPGATDEAKLCALRKLLYESGP